MYYGQRLALVDENVQLNVTGIFEYEDTDGTVGVLIGNAGLRTNRESVQIICHRSACGSPDVTHEHKYNGHLYCTACARGINYAEQICVPMGDPWRNFGRETACQSSSKPTVALTSPPSEN